MNESDFWDNLEVLEILGILEFFGDFGHFKVILGSGKNFTLVT